MSNEGHAAAVVALAGRSERTRRHLDWLALKCANDCGDQVKRHAGRNSAKPQWAAGRTVVLWMLASPNRGGYVLAHLTHAGTRSA